MGDEELAPWVPVRWEELHEMLRARLFPVEVQELLGLNRRDQYSFNPVEKIMK